MHKNDLKTLTFLILCLVLIGLASALRSVHISFAPKPKKAVVEAAPRLNYVPQYVLISFDGSRAINIWQMIQDFKEEMKASGKKLNVTHFINAAYFLTEDNRTIYTGPHQEIGYTNIGVSEDLDHVRQRIGEVNEAIADGDEIAVHTVGHLSGLHWTKGDWIQELTSFDEIMFGLDKIYPDANLPRLNLTPADVVGFRAPYLDHNGNLYEALHDLPQYRYDSSEVGLRDDAWPTKDEHGLWHIPLGMVDLGVQKLHILAMDYNLYRHDSDAKDQIKKGTPEWQKIYDDTLAAFKEYFNHNYSGSRAPVLIGYHFQIWNDGVYWEALKTFATDVCGQPQVVCTTFKDLVNYMDDYGVPKKL